MSGASAPQPDPSKLAVSEVFHLEREGVELTQFFVSYSGAMLISEDLPTLTAEINGQEANIYAPVRVAEASHRPTPQLRLSNIKRFFSFDDFPPRFPLQVSTFPTQNTESGAGFSVWFGPSEDAPPDGPQLPPDTLIVELHGSNSQNEFDLVFKYFVEPLMSWLRVLTGQWWLGRSIEGATKPLQFVVMIGAERRFAGSPTPVIQFVSADESMIPITRKIWTDAADRGLGRKLPPPQDTLMSDANYMLASGEYRSGVILACCSIEANRDEILKRHNIKLKDLNVSKTDLLKHLSVGFEKVLGRNMESEDPDLFSYLKAFWVARGEAAHGKNVQWRSGKEIASIEDVPFGELSRSLRLLNAWVSSIRSQDMTRNA